MTGDVCRSIWIAYLAFQSVAAVEEEAVVAGPLCGLPETFHCDDKNVQCIESSKKCNGISECHGGFDESVIVCGCQPEEFQCNRTVCIDLFRRCDLHDDCEDGSDEQECDTYICPQTHFKCTNDFCVPLELSCNYHDDCGDNSDEAMCVYPKCRYTEWRCNNSECLSSHAFLCDGVEDCRDGSDERDCERHFIMANGLYVSKEHRCDGWPYYSDVMTDEENCGPCQEDQFQCHSHRCISISNVCDGICDCGYNCDDERNCTETPCLSGEWFYCGKVSLKGTPRCIRPLYVCDGENNCRDSDDGYDEYCNHTRLCEGRGCPDDRCAIYEGTCIQEPECVIQSSHAPGQCGTGECRDDQFTCANGECVNMTSRCDAAYDCRDLSDERNCLESHRCLDHQKMCDSGQCIPHTYWCDFVRDCMDGSDEGKQCYKKAKCEMGEFRCDSGQCIPDKDKCFKGTRRDGRLTGCADESHLLRCKNHTCSVDQFKCRNSYCVPSTARCNDFPECLNTLTDEQGCPYSCPYPTSTCTCRDIEMDCGHRRLRSIPDASSEQGLNKFLLSGNLIGQDMNNSTLAALSELTYLDLSNNTIRSLGHGYFKSLWRLVTLNLEDNEIVELRKGTFIGLINVNTLYLRRNRIEHFEALTFAGLSSLKALDLSNQRIREIPEMAFIGLRSVYTLNLSRNMIEYIADGAFNGMPNMKLLDISANQIAKVGNNVFNGLQQLSVMYSDEFRFCCLAPGVAKCYPEPDEFSSCKDLMSNFILRVSIWVLGIISLVGNTVVIIWRYKDARDSKVHSFLITNLAIGDLLMGIYLLVIAAVDLYYRGVYTQFERAWRHSILCRFAGFLSTFSSELSVFTLTVITVDRFVAIIFPFRFKRLDMRDAGIVMASMWILVILLAVIPLTDIDYFREFYGRSGVCLALHITPHRPSGWEYAVFIFLAMNCFSFAVIFVSYIWMFMVAKRTRAAARSPEMRKDHAMARRMTLIVLTDFCCWVPIIILGCASLGGATVPPQVFAWIAVFVLPLNAAVNPVLYTLSTASFLGLARSRASKFRRSLMNPISGGDTKTFVFDDRSSAYEKIGYSTASTTNKCYQAIEMTRNPRRHRGDGKLESNVPNNPDNHEPMGRRKRVAPIAVADSDDGLVPDVIYLYKDEDRIADTKAPLTSV